MLDMKLDKKRLAMHWHYYRVRYFLITLAALVAANFLYTATAPKTPPDRKIDIVLVGVANNDQIDVWQKAMLSLLPLDQAEVNLTATPLIEGQEYTVMQVLSARLSSREGTIWILPKDFFNVMASQGAFLPLDDDLASFRIPEGADLSAGRAAVQVSETDPGVKRLYGIPLDKSIGLATLLYDPSGLVLAFPVYADVNYGNAILAANYLLGKTEAMPEYPEPVDTGFGLYAASYWFGSADTSAWSKAIKARLNADPGVFLVPYHVGRETLVAEQLQARMKNYPSGVCVVPQGVFTALAKRGALAPLDSVVSKIALPEGADLSAGKEAVIGKDGKPGERKLYGIPLDGSAGLYPVVNPRGMMLAFPVQSEEVLATAIEAANAVLAQD